MGTRNVASSKQAATAINTSTTNNKDLHFVGFDCSCQAPEVDLSQVDLQQFHNLPQVTDGVASSFDAAAYFPDVILARSLVVGDVNVVLLFECDYVQNCTQLYKQLEQEDWQGVDEFLVTGIWPDSFSKDPLSPSKQVRTWVTRFDQHEATKCHWSILPLQYVHLLDIHSFI
jgi:hypothetical protein